MYELKWDERWEEYFASIPLSIQRRFAKRIKKYQEYPKFKHHHHGLPYFVDKIGQYRVCFTQDVERKIRTFYYIGKHKDYEKWLAKHK
jgi:mRNA-degrading endonuclease RelE of RelBE toxin-antitoxin system